MKKKHEEHENHERWLVSYADFITLLFAFFVVMYSVSSVNEGKYKVLSESMVSAFSNSKPVGELSVLNLPVTKNKSIVVKEAPANQDNARSFIKVANAISMAKVPDGVKITSTERGLSIRIKDDALFESGRASLNPHMKEFLDLVAGLVSDLPNLIAVEGHTDNQPIRSAAFPSNWDLSTARANVLVRYFTEYHGLAPHRFSSTGFAGTRPIETNDTPEGKAENRRVEMIVLRHISPQISPPHPFLP
ncbi:MAG: OmpA family protein [Nitrospira sp.]|nr:OmpA family protein [Nitrospira sp.]MCB9711372.1 OmpA family protein [Nitrospiraceae bacterium]MDR4486310.1 OmpA family protein [Nitrospirales bacterium]MCA9465812.1 OmpA family protein [Nitrospira sp.]MCA9475492.1 OmpA family protein [Nitrospira sp.]